MYVSNFGSNYKSVDCEKIQEGWIVRLDGCADPVRVMGVVQGRIQTTVPKDRPAYIVEELGAAKYASAVWVDSTRVAEIVAEGKPIVCEALRLYRAGFWVIPAGNGKDCVRGAAQQYRDGLVSETTLRQWFAYLDKGLEIVGPPDKYDAIDFDDHDSSGGVYAAWRERVSAADPALLDKVCIYKTKTGEGRRVVWLADYATPTGGTTLAAKAKDSPLVERLIKAFVPCRSDAAEVPASWAYAYETGHIAELTDKLTSDEASILLDAARGFNGIAGIEKEPKPRNEGEVKPEDPSTPWGWFNLHCTWHKVLEPKGWTETRDGIWQRPGGTSGKSAGVQADSNRLYVYSASAYPFEKDKGYSLFDAFALLWLDDDKKAACREIRLKGWELGGVPPMPQSERDTTITVDASEVEALFTGDEWGEVSTSDDPHIESSSADLVERGDTDCSDDIFQSWDELCAIADAQKEDWFIKNWAEFGTLLLLTGQPFKGKSTMLAEVIAASANGSLFAEMPVAQVPIILLDFENREGILAGRIRRALDGNEGNIREILHRVPPVKIKTPLDIVDTGNLILRLRRKIGETQADKGVIVIDTFRSAYAGADELDVKTMIGVLTPLKKLAALSGWLIIVLHHNAKHSDQYSGSTAIASVADYLWNWQVDDNAGTGTLSMLARGDRQEPLTFNYDMALQRNVYIGTSAEVQTRKREFRQAEQDAAVLALFPVDPSEAVTFNEIGVMIGAANGKDKPASWKTIKTFVERQESSRRIAGSGAGTKVEPRRYHRTALGSEMVLRVDAGMMCNME